MEPPDSVPHPDAVFADITRDEHARLRTESSEAARKELPCERCGSTAEPVAFKPEFRSVERWIDPAPYLACADCSHCLGMLSVWLGYPAWFMESVRNRPPDATSPRTAKGDS